MVIWNDMRKTAIAGFALLSVLTAGAQIKEGEPYGFETTTKNPVVIGTVERLSGPEAFSGTSLRLSAGSTAEFGVALGPESEYELTVMMRTESGEDLVSLEVSGLGKNNVTASSALAGWTRVRTMVRVPGNPGKVTLVFRSESASGKTGAWIDDILFTRKGSYKEAKPVGIQPLPARKIRTDRGITMQPDEKMAWMQDAKFGMFIHWGLYSGIGKGEWYMERSGTSPEEYRKYAYPESGDAYFAATEYNPAEWVALAKAAGMKYMNMTTMHHDGYALFESRYMNAFTSKQTHNRDFVKEYVEACRAAGLRVGLYKTLINWRFPGYYDVTGTDCKKNRFGYVTDPSHKENARLMKEELYCQVKELVTNYGRIDQIFWDGGWLGQQGTDADAAGFWESGKYLDPENEWQVNPYFRDYDDSTGLALGLMGLVRKYQPDILVNPRCGWYGDYKCEEGRAPVTGAVRTEDIYEKCMSMGPGWGYSKVLENPDKVITSAQIKRMLSDCVVRNMNLLLNVGPDRFGCIPETLRRPLLEVGAWLSQVGEAVYGTRGGPWDPVDGAYGFAYKDNTIYVYLFPDYGEDDFILPALNESQRVVSVHEVASGESLPFTSRGKSSVKVRIDRVPTDDIRILAFRLNGPVYD